MQTSALQLLSALEAYLPANSTQAEPAEFCLEVRRRPHAPRLSDLHGVGRYPPAGLAARQRRPSSGSGGIGMVDVDRQDLLRSLDERHDDLVQQLDELNQRIEAALIASGAAPGPRAGVLAMTANAAGPSGRSC